MKNAHFGKILKYEFLNIIRSRWVIFNFAIFLLLTIGILQISGNQLKAELSLSTISIILVPLISILFTTFYTYQSDKFTQLMLTQPVLRKTIFNSQVFAMFISLAVSSNLGIILGFIFCEHVDKGVVLLITTLTILNLIFTLIGNFFAQSFTDRMKGFGISLVFWFYLVVIHDLLILIMLVLLKDYPMDLVASIMGTINPIDLSRVELLSYFDAPLLLGHSSALVRNLILSKTGFYYALIISTLWIVTPFLFTRRKFLKKDF